jgi:NTE family protein
MNTMTQRIGLALGGGGARGVCQIAFIKALDEMGLCPSIISGTSIGAIIGGFYAAGMNGRRMERLIKSIKLREIRKLMDFHFRTTTALFKGKGVEKFLDDHLPVKTFEELDIPLKVTASEFWTRELVVIKSGELAPAIRASMSLPAVFDPVTIDGRVLVDGGAVNPLPYDLIRDSCDLLIAIDVLGTRTPKPGKQTPKMFQSIMTTFDIMETSIVEAKFKFSQPDIYVRPSLTNIEIHEFHRAPAIIRSVRDDVKRFQTEVEKALQKKRFMWF